MRANRCVLLSFQSNGKSKAASNDDDDDDEDDDEEDEDDEDDEEDDDDMSDVDSAPKSKKSASTRPNPAASSSKSSAAAASVAASSSSTSVLLAGAPLSSLLPVPSLASISADVGMDQLRQRLHERINGLSNKRKPEDHPFAKKRMKKEKEKREKNKKKPSQHKNTHPRDDNAENGDEPTAKKHKSSSLPHPSSTVHTSSPSLKSSSSTQSAAGVRAADLLDSNDFQFAALKPLDNPVEKHGSYSLQGAQQRKKKKSDDQLLKEVTSFEEKIRNMKAAGKVDEASQLEQARSMENALQRAQGIKVKDDAKLLKKSLKREEKKKEKSRAEWSERLTAQKQTQDAHHAAKIASASKKGKGDRSKVGTTADDAKVEEKKTGRGAGRAGFEGKGKKFLN